MGQYFILTNYTRNQKAHVGAFYGDWEGYLTLFGWSKDDNVVAYGDNGDVYHLNPEFPETVTELGEEGVWEMCKFAAKKLGITPEKFYEDFLKDSGEADNSDECKGEMEDLDYYELSRAVIANQQDEKITENPLEVA